MGSAHMHLSSEKKPLGFELNCKIDKQKLAAQMKLVLQKYHNQKIIYKLIQNNNYAKPETFIK